MPITTSTTLVHGSKFLAGPFQASYSFNNSNKADFVDIGHYIVMNHMATTLSWIIWSIVHVSISNNGLPMNFFSNKWIATYSFNYSNKTGFVNNDHYIVISHMVHYTCLNLKKKCLPMNFLSNKWIYEP